MFGPSTLRGRRFPWVVLAALALASMVCTLPFSGNGEEADLRATITALEAELEAVQAATGAEEGAPAGQQPTRRPAESPGALIEDSFDSDRGTFPIAEGMQISDGAYLLGPFQECANDVGNFDNPVGCNAVCRACGANAANYRLKVQFTFEEGLTDRGYGVILRFLDEDQDAMLDYEDYLLALGFNSLENRFSLYVHVPNQIDPWRVVKSGQAGLLRPGRLNRLDITSTNSGRLMDIFLNHARILTLTADAPLPGETLVSDWADSGAVGFLILGRRVQARFDNFSFEPLP